MTKSERSHLATFRGGREFCNFKNHDYQLKWQLPLLALGFGLVFTACGAESITIESRSDSSQSVEFSPRSDRNPTVYQNPLVMNDMGMIHYTTSPMKHIYLHSGDAFDDSVADTFLHLPPGNGTGGAEVSINLSDIDKYKHLSSARVYNAGLCSSHPLEFNYTAFGIRFNDAMEASLNAIDGVVNAEIKAKRLQPILSATPINSGFYGNADGDHFRVEFVWDAERIEGGLIGDVFECNGARVWISFDIYYRARGGALAVDVENFDILVEQQPNWEAPIGYRRCRAGVRRRIEEQFREDFPSAFSTNRQMYGLWAMAVPVEDTVLEKKSCLNPTAAPLLTCTWDLDGETFAGWCEPESGFLLGSCTKVAVTVERVHMKPDRVEVVWMDYEDDRDNLLFLERNTSDCNPERYQNNSPNPSLTQLDVHFSDIFYDDPYGLLP